MGTGSRELLLLRHGRAEGGYEDDLARSLTDPGKRDIQRIGVHLQTRDWLPNATVASPAIRTHVTAEKTLKAGGQGIASLTVDSRIYEASTTTLLNVLATFRHEPSRVLLVGHNPGLSDLVTMLTKRSTIMAPGMLTRLRMPTDWTSLTAGSATLADVVDPKTLPRDFPFPSPQGTQWRSRPAYYYVQSGVVPYRRTDDGLEVMIIGSSKKKRWVVPKGIVTPGLSPQQSAAKEAREEAGIEGTVDGPVLGTFMYEKWGAPVTCEVFPMLVTRVLDESDWEEPHRGRTWVSPDAAIETLGRDGLKDAVRALTERFR